MHAEAKPVPFVGLNACLREDFVYRVLHQVLEFLPAAAAPARTKLSKALDSVPIHGFRQFQRAPRGLQARAAIARFRDSGDFIGAVLEVWLEAKAALATAVEGFLEQQKIPRARIRPDDGRFQDGWSLDEVLQLADRFREGHADADRDEIALLLCCLTDRAPIAAVAPPQAPAPPA